MGLFGRRRKADTEVGALDGLLGGLPASSVQIVGDAGKVTEEQRAKLRALGIDLDQVLAGQQTWAPAVEAFTAQAWQQAAQAAGQAAGGTGDDETLSRLERLAALRAQGVLTEAEFAEQKARILGES